MTRKWPVLILGIFLGILFDHAIEQVIAATTSTLGNMDQPLSEHVLGQSGSITVDGVQVKTYIKGLIQSDTLAVGINQNWIYTPGIIFLPETRDDLAAVWSDMHDGEMRLYIPSLSDTMSVADKLAWCNISY